MEAHRRGICFVKHFAAESWHSKRVLDPELALLSHLWDMKTEKASGMFWGRGKGWTVLAHAEVLAALPRDHPRRAEVLAAYARRMDGIRKCEDPEGGWHQLLDHPESWVETSATGVLTYGIARCVNEGWLDVSFAESERRGWAALEKKVTEEGDALLMRPGNAPTNLARFLQPLAALPISVVLSARGLKPVGMCFPNL